MRLWLGRLLIASVLIWNVQCALAFLISPVAHVANFELSGAVGAAMVRGMGVLFLMWNVPYAVALWHPVRYRVALYETLAMQSIGLIGESLILMTLPAVHLVARASIIRFIVFDAAGLVLLLAAAWLTQPLYKPRSESAG